VRTAIRLFPSLAGSLVVLITLLSLRSLPTTRVLAIWVVLLTAIALRELVRSAPRNEGRRSRFEAALGTRAAPPITPAYAGMERELVLSSATAGHAHRRLLPLLRTAADVRLRTRHGCELERQPELARRLLGEPTWALLRPDRPEPEDRLGRGPRREELAAVIAKLEEL
jgi:hypothetical protein